MKYKLIFILVCICIVELNALNLDTKGNIAPEIRSLGQIKSFAAPMGRPIGMPNIKPIGTPNIKPIGMPNIKPIGTPNIKPIGTPNIKPIGTPNIKQHSYF